MRILSITTGLIILAQPAYAHMGHAGELAGHAHWVGIAAGVAAIAIAAALVKGKKNTEVDNEQDDVSSEETASGETGETA
ncbi:MULTISPECIES: DUF6732 family protein [unclassified Lentilitoribacter]|uniref:DUF6732 family protein n=1 Tax=unclassified Lentilitoribacter TaxID=2647570 RepID=UPI0013A6ADE4|nr:DUF6732 family protein [Lentilitoribacter sp. Alg239-R112]